MRTITTLLLALFITTAQADGYKEAMTEALQAFAECQTVDDYKAAANTFQRIAHAEPNAWLPLYYHAHCYILMGFRPSEGAEKQDAYLDEAQKSIDRMLEINELESEIYTLQSLLHTARLVIDPMSRGQKMMVASGQAIRKALALNPENPRAQYMLLSNEVGTARFFGKDASDYCDRINQLYANWDALNQVEELHPAWGKGQVAGLKKNCQ